MRSFDELAQKVRDPKALTFERKNAMQELAKHGDAQAAAVLGELLGDGEASIRREAIGALGAIKAPGTAELLIRALDDKDRSCVRAALDAIGSRSDVAAVPALERLVETADFSTRIEAERLLKRLGAAKEEEQPIVETAEAPRVEAAPRGEAAPQEPKVVLVPPPPPHPKAPVAPPHPSVTARPPMPPPPPRAPQAAGGTGAVPRAPIAVAPPVPEARPAPEHVSEPLSWPSQPRFRNAAPPPPPNVRRHSGYVDPRSGHLSREAFVERARRARSEQNAGVKAAAVVFAVIVFFILLVAVCSPR